MSSKVQVLKQNTQQAIIDQEKILLKKFSVSLKGSRPTENERNHDIFTLGILILH